MMLCPRGAAGPQPASCWEQGGREGASRDGASSARPQGPSPHGTLPRAQRSLGAEPLCPATFPPSAAHRRPLGSGLACPWPQAPRATAPEATSPWQRHLSLPITDARSCERAQLSGTRGAAPAPPAPRPPRAAAGHRTCASSTRPRRRGPTLTREDGAGTALCRDEGGGGGGRARGLTEAPQWPRARRHTHVVPTRGDSLSSLYRAWHAASTSSIC